MVINLLKGNCIDVMKTLPENSLDSIVTDPPYGLAFMGKSWDSFESNDEYREFSKIWAKESYRVLKPGGYLLSFSGTRTYHWMAVGIEQAGFVCRDMIEWVYGCLSSDTEIVTIDGIKSYTTIKQGDLVLCYDKYTGEYSYQPVEEIYEYNIKDTAYRIQSNFTDQVVSRNHRCLIERNGREVFVFAEDLKSQENIPFLENLSELQQSLSNIRSYTSFKKQSLFKRMWKRINWKEKFGNNIDRKSFWKTTTFLSSLWNIVLQKQEAFAKSINSSMFQEMQWNFAWGGMEKTCLQRQNELVRRKREKPYKSYDRRNKSGMERWNNLQTFEGKSQGSEVCSLSNRVYDNGSKGRIYNGTSSFDGKTVESSSIENRSGSSHKSQCIGQSNRESNVICDEQRPQTIRGWEGHKTSLATITPIEYEGIVWCVKVPTGSFVAIRNGMAFTTGNSGFPKSHNISKALDKMAGVERKIVGVAGKSGSTRNCMAGDFVGGEYMETSATTDEAKHWEGYGTALKPAQEPIMVAQKPISEKTIATNCLKWGVGGLNIDNCKIGTENIKTQSKKGMYGVGSANKMREQGFRPYNVDNRDIPDSFHSGRFPANFIHDGSEEVLALFPYSKDGVAVEKNRDGKVHNKIYGKYNKPAKENVSYGAGGSAARFFYCAKTSTKERHTGLDIDDKNNHPTVKPIDLMKYLVRLVTPHNGTILDPFMGSGSTGIAALLEGKNFIGIEMNQEYFNIAKNRIESYDNTEF